MKGFAISAALMLIALALPCIPAAGAKEDTEVVFKSATTPGKDGRPPMEVKIKGNLKTSPECRGKRKMQLNVTDENGNKVYGPIATSKSGGGNSGKWTLTGSLRAALTDDQRLQVRTKGRGGANGCKAAGVLLEQVVNQTTTTS